MGATSPDMQFVRQFASVFQNNFPERVYRIVVYPGGLVFTGLWNLVKWFVDPVTQQKVKPVLTLGGVQEFIEDEYIPVSMGGKCDYEFDLSGGDLPPDPPLPPQQGGPSAAAEVKAPPETVFNQPNTETTETETET